MYIFLLLFQLAFYSLYDTPKLYEKYHKDNFIVLFFLFYDTLALYEKYHTNEKSKQKLKILQDNDGFQSRSVTSPPFGT